MFEFILTSLMVYFKNQLSAKVTFFYSFCLYKIKQFDLFQFLSYVFHFLIIFPSLDWTWGDNRNLVSNGEPLVLANAKETHHWAGSVGAEEETWVYTGNI